ncbi:MAG TPA: UDP-N-acetylglucosamine 2-epimerase (non-hydrolyzing) [Solirubrobacteraceae bacterium]|jgi:UDP-N-acetylglucosamine 2-epimerase (non-hydrolysing)|nr:UDP-N-acetylglucosamine 2-epimerase (non-hydrolyzing) [Solirubrobacteraceae bacterium]
MKILVPMGTRPEIVKLAPVVQALRAKAGLEVMTVATGQHYDRSLTNVFYEELGLHIDVTWKLEGDEATRLGAMMTSALAEIDAAAPSLVLLLGDTYTVPVFCLAARRHAVPVAHIEAGLRSFNPTSMEEVNRRTAAALASLHLAPTSLAARFLEQEGVPRERVKVVGNPVIDVLRQAGVEACPPRERRGVVLTAHRPTNVDDPARLAQLVEILRTLANRLAPVTFPVHPRTRSRLLEAGALATLEGEQGLRLTEPLPYEEMLALMSRSQVVVTDSGGLQEEASWLGIPTVVLRRSTPRWEGVKAGAAVLTGLDVDCTVDAAIRLASAAEQARVWAIACPYGDGHTAERIAATLTDPAVTNLLRFEEPDFTVCAPPC